MLDQAKSFLENFEKLDLVTSSYSISNIEEVSFIQDEFNIYIVGLTNQIHIEQIKYNPKVILNFGNEEENLKYYGRAKIVKATEINEKRLSKLSKADSIVQEGIFTPVLVKIIPIEIEVEKWDFVHRFSENKPSLIKETFRSIGTSIKIWFRATRLSFVTVSLMGVLIGTAAAFFETGSLNSWLNFLLALMGIAFFHIAVDLLNDFSDHRSGLDETNVKLTPFSGGSRMIQSKLFSPTRVLMGAIFSLAICLAIGLYLNFTVDGNVILYMGLAGAVLGIFYVGAPIKLVYYGLGELAIFLSFGPGIVYGSYYLQNQVFSWNPLLISILIGLLISLILYINQFPDYDADKAKKKLNWVVLLGKKKARHVFAFFMILTYILLIIFSTLNILPLLSLIALASIPLPIIAIITTYKHYDNYLAMIPASAMTILTCLAFSILLGISLFVAHLI
jgi:1,4-dihydroxy-2-naphthoate octaprenyltransferase